MHRWKLSALAAAAFVSSALTSLNASALTLGALRVDSALGENLRAEIPITQATPAELNNLLVQVASPDVFRARGIDYSTAASAIRVQMVRKPDGTAVLQLRSNTPLNDPFIDVIVDSQWNTGNLQRSYTILLDPPATKRSTPQVATAPQVTASAPASVTGRTYSSSPRVRATVPTPAAAAAEPAAAAQQDASVRVRSGDTAGRIANAHRPAGVSLDQMLVAMQRSNPQAFVNGNVNRLRAGAVLKMPSREQALETSVQEARQIVAAQSRDFNAYRRSLAAKAPQATVQAAARSASGQVQAQVADSRPAADNVDKLTLSKGSVQEAAHEEKLAIQKQAEAQENRLSELQRNLAELNQIAQSSATATPAAAQQPASDSTAPAAAPAAADAAPATPAVEVTNATAAAAQATADTAADSNAATAPAAAAPAPAEQPKAAAPAKPKPVFIPAPVPQEESLLDHPLLPAGGALVAALLGLLGYTYWKRRRAAQAAEEDPGLGDSQLQPDTFFAGSGGQHVDTTDGAATTMAYAPSQLDGGADVDPVAEADVYLAYGRDVQAEEILKEALRTQPDRLPVYTKLAEIYAKRHDVKALEETANSLHAFCQPTSPEWQRMVEIGRQIAPQNPLFAAASVTAAAAASQEAPTSSFAAALQASAANAAEPEPDVSAAVTPAAPVQEQEDEPATALDFKLELPGEPAEPTTEPAAPAAPAEPASELDSLLDLDAPYTPTAPPTLVQDTVMPENAVTPEALDLDLSGFEAALNQPAEAAPEAPAADSLGIDLDLDAAPAAAPAEPEAAAPAPAAAPAGGVDFDLNALDLDLPPADAPAEEAQPVQNQADDPLATKLDLAREFNAIGDSEGARALIKEVLAEASGSLKDRAQKMLAELD